MVLGVRVCGKEEGFAFGVDYAYELERWRPDRNPPWGSDASYLLRTDPGGWMDADGRCYYTMDEVTPPLPPGWEADLWRASTGFGEEGFQYARSFQSGQWADSSGQLSMVRRRMWCEC